MVLQVQREAARPGETIYRGHHSWDLMRQLQLGIMFSIAKSAREAPPAAREQPLAEADFAQQVGAVGSPSSAAVVALLMNISTMHGHAQTLMQVILHLETC